VDQVELGEATPTTGSVWPISMVVGGRSSRAANSLGWFPLAIILSFAVDHGCDLGGRVEDGVAGAAA
jgi:hypothetical protein